MCLDYLSLLSHTRGSGPGWLSAHLLLLCFYFSLLSSSLFWVALRSHFSCLLRLKFESISLTLTCFPLPCTLFLRRVSVSDLLFSLCLRMYMSCLSVVPPVYLGNAENGVRWAFGDAVPWRRSSKGAFQTRQSCHAPRRQPHSECHASRQTKRQREGWIATEAAL